jgi:hypothetical protein
MGEINEGGHGRKQKGITPHKANYDTYRGDQ